MDFSLQNIITTVVSLAIVMWSICVHEVSHGFVAYLCGDNTAKNAGRLTLNPLAHLHPVGSVILPLAMTLLGGPAIGFAKPVPYNPYNLKNRKRDEILVAFAGPLSNILQALIFTGIWQLLYHFNINLLLTYSFIPEIITSFIYVNLILAFFNLIPLPPLDGSSIIAPFLSGKALDAYYKIHNYSLPILIALLYLVPMVFHVDPINAYFDFTAGNIYSMLVKFW